MKKVILILVLLLSGLFYAVATNYELIGVNKTDGFVFSENDIQKNLYAGNLNETVDTKEVKAAEGIYKRLNTIYYGEDPKIKVNTAYPMYIKDGQAIKLLSGNESLITNTFEFVDGYKNLIINESKAFNSDAERSDNNEYILVHLSNNLYVNTMPMHVTTFMNEYDVDNNSIIYFTPDSISFYSLNGDSSFNNGAITDIDETTLIRFGDTEILYSDLLLKLGEVVEYHQRDITQPKAQEEYVNNLLQRIKDIGGTNGQGTGSGDASGDTTGKTQGESKNTQVAQKNPEATRPQEPEKAKDPEPQPKPIEWEIVYPNWELPVVTMGNKFIPGVYSLQMSVNVKDYSGVIYGGVIFEVYSPNATVRNATHSYTYSGGTLKEKASVSPGTSIKVTGSNTIEGKIYYIDSNNDYYKSSDVKLTIVKRSSFRLTTGENIDVLFGSLVPNTEYLISGYYTCLDKYARPYSYVDKYGVEHTQIDFLTPRYFKTNDVKDLGDIIFEQFDSSKIFGDKIQIENVGFASASDKDAVSSLSRIQYTIKKDGKTIVGTVLSDKHLASLLQMQKITFTYSKNIESNSTYDIEFTCFDMYGNELNVKNNKATAKTCKKLLTGTVDVEHPQDSQQKEILTEINLTFNAENPDSIEYENLKYLLTDSSGNLYSYYDEVQKKVIDYIECKPGVKTNIKNLKEGEKYTYRVVGDMDNGDGQGKITRVIITGNFSTSPIDLLGPLWMNVKNVSTTECPNTRYEQAIFEVSVAANTNKQLLNYVDELSISLTGDGGSGAYTFTSEDIEKLKNNETLVIDTKDDFGFILSGNTEYQILFSANYNVSETVKKTISARSTLTKFTTIRKPVTVLMTNPVTAPGYINTTIRIEDIDDVVVGNKVMMKIYELVDDKQVLFSSHLLDKNTPDYQQIILSSDPTLSTDGISYNIKNNTTYSIVFIAEEANTEYGASYNYTLAKKNILISTGIEGEIFLNNLNTADASKYKEGLTENRYAAKIGVTVKYPSGWTGNNDLYVDIYSNDSLEAVDELVFTYDRSKSTDKTRVYVVDSKHKEFLKEDSLTLEYNEESEKYEGIFEYLVDKSIDNTISYKFKLYTVLMDKIKIAESKVTLDPTTYHELPNDKYEEDMNISIAYPSAMEDNHTFYIDIFNEDESSDIPYSTLLFSYLESESTKTVKKYNVFETTNLSTPYKENLELTYNETSKRYEGTLKYIFNKQKLDTKGYSFSIYYKALNDLLFVPLDETTFTTEKPINTISNINEFFAIKDKNAKYVVVADLFYNDTVWHSYNGGKWGGSKFNAQVDFQGFTLTYSGYNNLIYLMSGSASISNMVYKTNAKLTKTTNGYDAYAGTLVYENYGKLSNIQIEYTEVQPEDIASGDYFYRGTYYWTDNEDHTKYNDHRWRYLGSSSTLSYNNFGVIENFTLDIQSKVNRGTTSGMICTNNYNTVRNGYVYSSLNDDYKALAWIYNNYNYNNNTRFGYICAQTLVSGSYVGVTENVYVLGNIDNKHVAAQNQYLGLVCGYNNSIVRNTFTNGNVTTNSKAYTSYGPNLATTSSTLNRNPNNNYISSYSYSNSLNLQTSVIALRNKIWVNSVLNVNYNEFNIDEMITVGCYPQVLMSEAMPAQTLLELPELPRKDDVDILASEVYQFGQKGNEGIDRLLNQYRSGNELGDLITGPVEGSEFTSNSQIIKVYISDKTASQIHSLSFQDPTIVNNVLLQTMDGTGLTSLYIEVYNPSQAISKYAVNGIYFKDYKGEKVLPMTPVYRDLEFLYTKLITTVDDWKAVINNPSQNHRLGADLDFTGISMSNIFVNSTFSGTLDGDGHKIKNIEYDSKAFASIYPKGVDGSYVGNAGLMKAITGKVKNLTLENVNIEGAENVGALAATASGAVIENVYVKNSYIAGSNRVAGLVATSNYSDILKSGVINTKVISVGGRGRDGSESWKSGVAGIVAYAYESNNFKSLFVNNIYLEAFTVGYEYSTAGGLFGYINGNGNRIDSCYATGVINTNAYAAGGLIGINYSNIELNHCYSDVDVNSYYYNAAGLIGVAWSGTTTSAPLLSFGDVHSQTILGNETKNTFFKMISNRSYVNGIYYNNASLMGDSELIPTGSSFDASLISSETIIDNYLGSNFKIDDNAINGVLPKLIDSEGELLPYQEDTYISGIDSEINVSVYSSTEALITIDVSHPSYIRIDDVYTDYTYINSQNDINGEDNSFGVKSLTNRKALDYILESNEIAGGTELTLTVNGKKAYYDYYTLTAIKYTNTKTNKVGYLKINDRLNSFEQEFKTIDSMADFDEYVSPSVAENFKVTNDLDFLRTVNYYDEKYANLVVNRFVGTKGTDEDYLDLKDGEEYPYYKISNYVNNEALDVTKEHGWIYGYDNYLFKVVLSEIANISFDSCEVTSPNTVGLIGLVQQSAKNLVFTNCKISNTEGFVGPGLIRYLKGSLENVYADKISVSSVSANSAILAGTLFNGAIDTKLSNIYIKNSTLNNNSVNTGLVVGRAVNDYAIYTQTINVTNVTVEDSTVTSNNNSTAAIIGNLSSNSYFTFDNINVNNVTVRGTTYIGGVVGYNSNNSGLRINNAYVYNSRITGTDGGNSYVGGIVGIYAGVLNNVTVKDSTIIGYGQQIGGLVGYYNSSITGGLIDTESYEDDGIQNLVGYITNTKVYGRNYVGGAIGYGDGNISKIIVTNTEIKANNYAGGIIGRNNGSERECVVTNTTITPWKQSEAIYGPAYSSSQGSFGGISGDGSFIYNSIVTNSFVGGENANYVGGLEGYTRCTSNYATTESMVKDVIVIGKTYVGGLFGIVSTSGWGCQNFNNLYSNAYVYGNTCVGGISGYLLGIERRDRDNVLLGYYPLPVFENVYFTGALTSDNTAGALFGQIIGSDTTINMFRYVSSFPAFIKAKKVSPVFGDNTNTYAYNWTNLTNDSTAMAMSLYSNTAIYLRGEDGEVVKEITMKELIENTKDYADYITNDVVLSGGYKAYVDTIENVNANFSSKLAGDAFIALYDNVDEFRDKYYTYSTLDTRTSSVIGTKYFRLKDMQDSTDTEDYMPMTNSTNINSLNYYKSIGEGESFELIGNRYHSGENIFVGEDKYSSVRVNQGVAIPGTALYDKEAAYMTTMYELYKEYGFAGVGFDIDDYTGYLDIDPTIDPSVLYRGLPNGYKQVEYIESTGTQWIDTEYAFTSEKHSTKFMYSPVSNSGGKNVAGYSKNKANYEAFYYPSNGTLGIYNGTTSVRTTSVSNGAKYTIVDNNTGGKGSSSNVSVNGVKTTYSKNNNNVCGVTMGLFTQHDTVQTDLTTSRMSMSRIYYFQMYDNGVLVRDLVPCLNENTSEYGMYDLVSKKFYGNSGTGTLKGGDEVSNIGGLALPIDSLIKGYQNKVNHANIDILDNLHYACSSINGLKYIYYQIDDVDGNTLTSGNITTEKTIGFTYNFKDPVSVYMKAIYDDGSGIDKDCVLIDEDKYEIDYSKVTLYGDNAYYLSNGDVINAETETKVSGGEKYTSLFNGYALKTDGSTYRVDNLSSASIEQNNDLYNFNYQGKNINTYGTYSTVNGTNNTSYRLFVRNGYMLVINNNTNAVGNPAYATYDQGKTKIVLLNDDGKVYSIGNSPVLTILEDFTNEGIKAITTNYHSEANSSNPYIGFEYDNGAIKIYNINTGDLVSQTTGTPPLTASSNNLALGSFLKTKLRGIFSTTSYEEEVSDGNKNAEQVSLFLTSNNLSLSDVVGYANSDEQGVEIVVDAIKNTHSNLEGVNALHDGKDNTLEGLAGLNITGSDSSTSSGIITDNTLRNDQDLTTVFNGETKEFDIVDVNSLLEDPENVVSENSKVYDKATLNSLYNELGKAQDNTTRRGLIIYIVVALAIVVLIIPFSLIKKRFKK